MFFSVEKVVWSRKADGSLRLQEAYRFDAIKAAGSGTEPPQGARCVDEFYDFVEYLKFQWLVTAYCL